MDYFEKVERILVKKPVIEIDPQEQSQKRRVLAYKQNEYVGVSSTKSKNFSNK